jgi:hypothetical protein
LIPWPRAALWVCETRILEAHSDVAWARMALLKPFRTVVLTESTLIQPTARR